MSKSALATYIGPTTQKCNKRNGKVSVITIHHAAGKLDMNGFTNVLESEREVSFNYAIGHDGTIGSFVDEDYRAWTSSNRENDYKAITIEVSNSSNSSPWPISDKAYNSLLNLCEDICRRHRIAKLKFVNTSDTAKNIANSNVTLHKWFTSTVCPGPTLENKIPDLVKTVNSRLNQSSTYVTEHQGSNSITTYDAIKIGVDATKYLSVNYDKINPYIITIDRNTKYSNVSKYKKAEVVGAVIEAGYKYDVTHQVVANYRNPKLAKQIEAVHKANMPFGLFAHVRARSLDEARLELQDLSLVIQKYPPALGVWLSLNLVKSTATNNSILEYYYDKLVDMGLSGKIGIYVTKTELSKITWKSFQNKMYLWIINHVNSLNQLEESIDPSMFDV